MSVHRPLALLTLVLTAALLLAGCGGSGGGMQDMEGMDGEDGGRQGQAEKKEAGDGGGGMEGMDMGGNASAADAAREMVEVALENAEHRELRGLADDVVTAQEAEIEDLRAIKEQEYGTSEIPSGMDQQQMDAMGMADPQELAERRPFDKAFIDAMIPHHESAIAMANAALEGSDNPEIRGIARAIVEAQEKEIARMEAWRQDWYPAAA